MEGPAGSLSHGWEPRAVSPSHPEPHHPALEVPSASRHRSGLPVPVPSILPPRPRPWRGEPLPAPLLLSASEKLTLKRAGRALQLIVLGGV